MSAFNIRRACNIVVGVNGDIDILKRRHARLWRFADLFFCSKLSNFFLSCLRAPLLVIVFEPLFLLVLIFEHFHLKSSRLRAQHIFSVLFVYVTSIYYTRQLNPPHLYYSSTSINYIS